MNVSQASGIIKQYAARKKCLKFVSYGGVVLLGVVEILFGQLRYQPRPIIVVDGVSPQAVTVAVVCGLISILVFNIVYWRCPNCRRSFFWTVRECRYRYTYDLATCPNCESVLKELSS